MMWEGIKKNDNNLISDYLRKWFSLTEIKLKKKSKEAKTSSLGGLNKKLNIFLKGNTFSESHVLVPGHSLFFCIAT